MYILAEAPAPAKATKGTKAAAAPKAKAKAKAKPEMDTLADKMQFLTMKNVDFTGKKVGWTMVSRKFIGEISLENSGCEWDA